MLRLIGSFLGTVAVFGVLFAGMAWPWFGAAILAAMMFGVMWWMVYLSLDDFRHTRH
jgi:hypothetical protein